ncbi:Smg-4/UPF3 family-domain-containing protein [Lipomyces kononenkoae]
MATRKILVARPHGPDHSTSPLSGSSVPSKSGAVSKSASGATGGGRSRAGSISTNQDKQQRRQDTNMKTKFVIRRLPPLYTEEEFKAVTAEYLNPSTVEWSYYVQGKMHKSKSTPTTYSRAYAKFKDVESLIAFNKAFGGKAVKDTKGNESAMQIEFAPYEKIPKAKVKTDARQGTIDSGENAGWGSLKIDADHLADPEFLAFQESLTAPPVAAPIPVPSTESGERSNGVQTTPLIEYLRTVKLVKKSSGGSGSRAGKKEKETGKKDKKKRERNKSKKAKESEKAQGNERDTTADARVSSSHGPQSESAESAASAAGAASSKDHKSNAGKDSRHRSRGGRDKKKKDAQSQQAAAQQSAASTPRPKILAQSSDSGGQNMSVQSSSTGSPAPTSQVLPAPTVTLPQTAARMPPRQASKNPAPGGSGGTSDQIVEPSASGKDKPQSRHRRGGGGRGGKTDDKNKQSNRNSGGISTPAEAGGATTSGIGGASTASSGGRGGHRGGRRHHGGNRGGNDGTSGGGPPPATS